MSKRVLMKGNEAMAEGAIIAGCRFYFGYPITPQNEVPAYMSKRLPEVGGVFVQAESEVASINMLFGASAAGARAMTSTSSPGYSLMQEGISYLAAAHLPCLIANVQRGGPGLGNIAPSQADYFQATKGGGHGDYHIIVLAPCSPQEMLDFAILGFDLADKYRIPVLLLADGIVGQMMETVEIKDNYEINYYPKEWALTGCKNRNKNVIRSLWLDDDGVENNNFALQEKYRIINENEVRYENYYTDDAELIYIAYGASARVCKGIVDNLREKGLKVGLIRPITLYPFPYKIINDISQKKEVKGIYVVEMSSGQMLEDVKLAVGDRKRIYFYGKMGGKLLEEDCIIKETIKILQNEVKI